ncbi:hypothetical protein [uncultured Thiodictyon sp.]|jgi:hypothetical protein|uniref:hypothetical protein n=1 Tax=uncultured Thiodictyon sp. TaxID=1846217 RepID=UPI0025E250EC|nr:hypothetical protein [uncultured Thiodictyon sp.]
MPSPAAAAPPRGYTTEQTAGILLAKPNTLRVALCERGEYLGIRPVKLANRRLLWPADQVDAVARGESAQAATVPAARRQASTSPLPGGRA